MESKIKFILWHIVRNDGTKTIKLYINHNGDRQYYNTPYSCLESDFCGDGTKGDVLAKTTEDCIRKNNMLKKLFNKVEGLCLNNEKLSCKQLVKLIDNKSADSGITLLGFFNQFLIDCATGKHNRAHGSYLIYKKVYDRLIEFNKKTPTDFSTINSDWYSSFVSWLRKGDENCKSGRRVNTIGTYIKILKMIMALAVEREVTKIEEHTKKYFKAMKEEADDIYLNEEEIDKIVNVDLSHFPHLETERDRWLISYYFLLRFSDSLAFNKANFFRDTEGDSIKTATDVIVPVNEHGYILLEKYDWKLPVMPNQKSNEKIKEIARLAGLTDLVSVRGVTRPKFTMVKTHTARRSGATNLYLQGAPEKMIMHLGGWNDAASFRLYLKVTKLESAMAAKKLPFFSKKHVVKKKKQSLKVA